MAYEAAPRVRGFTAGSSPLERPVSPRGGRVGGFANTTDPSGLKTISRPVPNNGGNRRPRRSPR